VKISKDEVWRGARRGIWSTNVTVATLVTAGVCVTSAITTVALAESSNDGAGEEGYIDNVLVGGQRASIARGCRVNAQRTALLAC
jgi:hypothetical protein